LEDEEETTCKEESPPPSPGVEAADCGTLDQLGGVAVTPGLVVRVEVSQASRSTICLGKFSQPKATRSRMDPPLRIFSTGTSTSWLSSIIMMRLSLAARDSFIMAAASSLDLALANLARTERSAV
jgi:hypothetical protein